MLSAQALIGRQLGEFVVREAMGEGSFGLVFRAEQPMLQREAVVKVARFEVEGAVERFLREARLASRIDHPFAAHIYAYGAEPDGLVWIAMELVRGIPLDVLLERKGPMPLERALALIRRLCEVVHAVHEQGIVHRDLKPANLMVISRGGSVFVKLLDLGVAREVGQRADEDRDELAGPTGTPLYMAPEQWIDPEATGPPTDIYALGAITYELVIGRPPFAGATLREIAMQHARAQPPALGAGFPDELSRAIARALAKHPGERFPDALAFAAALEETSGIAPESFGLPALDAIVRDEVLMHAPQPIAEAVAALDAARTASAARTAMWDAAQVVASYVALLALAARGRAGSGRFGEAPAVAELLANLRRGGLDTAQWWRLARELVRPFATLAEVHPVPELVGAFFAGGVELKTPLDALLDSREREPAAMAPTSEIRTFLLGAIPALAAVLRSVNFLREYTLAVSTGERCERWMGVRRPVRPTLERSIGPAGHAALIDRDGAVAVTLWPLLQAAPPAAGAPLELFLFAGRGRRGGRLVSVGNPRLDHTDDNIWGQIGLAGDTGDASNASEDAAAPYRGLSTFTESDTSLFFGREREAEEFVNRLRTTPWIAVVGPSGSGKSSFVRAGVLPTLGASWTSIVVRPGAAPFAQLCTRFAAAGIEVSRDALLAAPEALGAALAAHGRAHGTSSLLLVDQLEELFTLCHDETERAAYAAALASVARAGDDVRVVVTLRDDFLVRAAQLEAFRDRLAASLALLTTPVKADLLRILREPARQAGYMFEDDALPEEMVDDVAGQPAALALLSFTAYQLWQFRDRHVKQLPRKAYRALGGVGGALAQHAEATLDAMTEQERASVREVFRHLITADGTRAVLSRAELLDVTAASGAGAVVIEKLINARLLVAMESATGESIEVVHEALLVAWPRLVQWRQQDAEGARLRDQLRAAARQWHERGRSRGLLWRGDALVEYELWRARYPGALTTIEEEFGRISSAEARRGRRIRRGALILAFAALAVALAVFARLRGAAETSRARAEASEAEAERRLTDSLVDQGRRAHLASDTQSALLYLSAALERGANTPGIRFMIGRALQALGTGSRTLPASKRLLWEVRYSRDGTRLATIGDDGDAKVWNPDTGALLATLPGHAPRGAPVILWGAGDRTIVTGDDAGAIRVFTPAGALVKTLPAHASRITTLQLSPDQATVVSAGEDGEVKLWNAESWEPGAILKGAGDATAAAWWSSDGSRILIGYEPAGLSVPGWATLWNPRTGAKVELRGHTANTTRFELSPAGDAVLTSSRDRTARLWDAKTGAVLRVLQGHDDTVSAIAWHPDGTRVATGSTDTTIKIWDRATGAVKFGLRGHTGRISHLRFTRDGKTLVSTSVDGTARIWDADRGSLIATFLHGGMIDEVSIRPDGTQLATSSWSGTAMLWPLTQQELERTIAAEPSEDPAHPDAVALVTPDRAAAVGNRDGGGAVWNLADGALTTLPVTGSTAMPAISADGSTIAIGDLAGRVAVFRGHTRVRVIQAHPRDQVLYCLSPTGAELITADADGLVTIWDVATGAKRASRTVGPVWEVNVAGDGTLVALGEVGNPGTAALVLDPATLATLDTVANAITAAPAPGVGAERRIALLANDSAILWGPRASPRRVTLHHKATVSMLRWLPAGDRVLVGQTDGSLDVWDDRGTSLAHIAAHAQFISTVAVDTRGTLAATTSADGIAKIWDLRTFQQIDVLRVAPGTRSISFVVGDSRLLASDGRFLDLWRISPFTGTTTELASILECRLRAKLEAGRVVTYTPPPCGS